MLPVLQTFGCLLFGLFIVNAVPIQLSCGSPFDCRWISGNDVPKSPPMIDTLPFSMICSTPFDCRWVRNDDLKPFYDSARTRQMFMPSIQSFPAGYGRQKRQCIHLGDEGCTNGQLPGSGKDDEFLGGSGNPGK